MRRLVDLSRSVGSGTPVFPGDGPVRITILDDTYVNLSRIDFSLHTGTHMDAPFHFVHAGATIDRVPLEHCIGPAVRIDLRGHDGPIDAALLAPHQAALRQASAAVLDTGWSEHWREAPYFSDHPSMTADGAHMLVECGVRLVGVDMPSVDREPYPAHRVLLGAGVLIVENLTNLEAIGADCFELIVLPLKLAGRDASPVRAIAITA